MCKGSSQYLKSLKDLSTRKQVIVWKSLSTCTEDAMTTIQQKKFCHHKNVTFQIRDHSMIN